MARTKFTTTLEETTITDLDKIKIEKNLKGKNDVIEYLTKQYWGMEENEYNKKKCRQSKSTESC
jgi:hypothetical protein